MIESNLISLAIQKYITLIYSDTIHDCATILSFPEHTWYLSAKPIRKVLIAFSWCFMLHFSTVAKNIEIFYSLLSPFYKSIYIIKFMNLMNQQSGACLNKHWVFLSNYKRIHLRIKITIIRYSYIFGEPVYIHVWRKIKYRTKSRWATK